MKFQKGILSDAEKEQIKAAIADAPAPAPEAKPIVLGDVEKNRLFQTQEEFTGSSNHYLKVLAVVGVIVLIAGGIIFYLMQPGVGDQVKGSRELEDAVRDNFLTVQKRSATDITFYKCDGYTWARVGVETRTDIPNPVYRIDKYAAKATPTGDNAWNITAQPVTSSGMDIPCS
jgi:hypothetical protein